MSVQQLISNWARSGQSVFTSDELEDFDQWKLRKRLVFVASLWSGNSQMAFRTTCELLSREDDVPVLVLDGDAESDLFKIYLPTELQSGNGLLVLLLGETPVGVVSGHDLELFRAALVQFLAD